MAARDLGALILLAALWGASYIFIRVAVPALGPFVLMGARVALASGALALYAVILARGMPKFRSRWKEFLIVGAANSAIPFTLIAAAEIELTASLAAILNSTTALFVAVVAAVWIGESLTVRRVVGLLLGFAGGHDHRAAGSRGRDPLAPGRGQPARGGAAATGSSVRVGSGTVVYSCCLSTLLPAHRERRSHQDPRGDVPDPRLRPPLRRRAPRRAGRRRNPRGVRDNLLRRRPRHGDPSRKREKGEERRVRCFSTRGFRSFIQDHLRAAEERELLAGFLIGDGRVPDLGGAPAVDEGGLARDRALVLGAQEVALEFDGRETRGVFGEGDEAAVAAGGVGERDDGGGVQVAVRG